MLPYRRVVIDTWLAPEQVLYSLSAATEPRQEIRLERPVAVFEGQVDNEEFRVSRIGRSQNPWRPRLKGEIEPMQPGGTRIVVRVLPAPGMVPSVLFPLTLGVLGAAMGTPVSWIFALVGGLPILSYAREAPLTIRTLRTVVSRAEQMWADNSATI